ncbi:MAG: methyltransferase domain-containing protein [Sphingomonadaceae bacterium]|nr:methyltransferase domain-containing protein [Sphingomonadaceae bacterium]
MANEDQRDYWNDDAGRKWVEHRKRLDSMLGPITKILIDAIAVRQDEDILDIGCGSGELSWRLAGLGANVTGIDLSNPMVDAARAAGSGSAQFLVADASEFCADTSFDAAVSRFGVMFFDDPAAAFANIHANLVEGGRLVFACWATPDRNAWAMVPAMAVRPFLADAAPPDPHAPGPFAFADDARVRTILSDAGFRDVECELHDIDVIMSESGGLDDATAFACQIGPGARALGELDKSERPKAREAIREALRPHIGEDEAVAMAGAIWLVSAAA